MRRTAKLLFGIALAAWVAAVHAQELGRLFFTPEQRAALDERRKARVPDKPAAVLVESPSTRLDGYVKRSGGKSTLFVNGEAIPEGAPTESMAIVPDRTRPDRATVEVGDSERRIPLKVGESLDRGTGEVHDGLGGGELQVERPGAGR
jgi:hypothetical protein